jgi:hypothetical protein
MRSHACADRREGEKREGCASGSTRDGADA